MLAISKETRPHWTVELLARGIASFAGPLPLAAANKGKNSEDPTVEEQFNSDPQTYRARLSLKAVGAPRLTATGFPQTESCESGRVLRSSRYTLPLSAVHSYEATVLNVNHPQGLTDLNSILPSLKVPFSLHHGTGDLVTSYHGSEKLYKEASSTDKKLHLYDDYFHICEIHSTRVMFGSDDLPLMLDASASRRQGCAGRRAPPARPR